MGWGAVVTVVIGLVTVEAAPRTGAAQCRRRVQDQSEFKSAVTEPCSPDAAASEILHTEQGSSTTVPRPPVNSRLSRLPPPSLVTKVQPEPTITKAARSRR